MNALVEGFHKFLKVFENKFFFERFYSLYLEIIT